MKGKFIIVEGIDGSGKSTVKNWIVENYNFEFHKTPYGPFEEASHLFNAGKVKPQERFSFYCGENVRASQYVSERISKGTNIILERYYLSTISYHASLYPEIYHNYKNIFKILFKPDLAIIVSTDFEIIKSRLLGQKLENNDKFYLQNDYYHEIYKNLYDATEFLDIPKWILNNNFSFQETQKEIIRIMKSI